MHRILDLIRNPSYSRTTSLLVIVIIALSIPLTVFVAQKQQEIRQHAAECTIQPTCPNGGSPAGDGNCYNDPANKTGFNGPVLEKEVCAPVAPPNSGTTTQETKPSQCGPGYTCLSIIDSISCKGGISGFCTDIGNGLGRCCQNSPSVQETNTCVQNGNECVGTPDACDRIGVPGEGTCPSGGPGICCKRNDARGPKSSSCMSDSECISRKGSPVLDTATCGDVLYRCDLSSTTSKDPAIAACEAQGGTCLDNGKCILGPNNFSNITCPIKTGTSGTSTPATQAPAASPPSVGGGPSCTLDSPGKWRYSCGSDAGCPAGQHKAIRVCSSGGEKEDPTCYPDTDVDGCSKKKAPPTSAPGFPISCTTGDPVCGNVTKVKAVKLTNGNYLCPSPYLNEAPTCPTALVSSSPTASPTPTPAPTQGVSCSAEFLRCPNNCSATTLPSGNWQCYTNATVSTANKVACEPTTCATAASPAPGATATPVPSTSLPNTKLTFTIGLDGLGTVGDSQNPSTSKVNTPKRTSKTFFFQIFDSTGTTEQTKGETQISYDSGLGKFKIANLDIEKGLPNGKYVAKVRVAGYKARIIRNITISGQTAEVPPVNLPTGDINPNNDVNLIDYEILRGCMFKDGTGNCEASDLDESGKVDEIDYNLFLRDFAAGQREE